jgi:hypothetical protein
VILWFGNAFGANIVAGLMLVGLASHGGSNQQLARFTYWPLLSA